MYTYCISDGSYYDDHLFYKVYKNEYVYYYGSIPRHYFLQPGKKLQECTLGNLLRNRKLFITNFGYNNKVLIREFLETNCPSKKEP